MEEVPVEPYIKDLSIYERASEYENEVDITNWRFYMAFDGDIPVGAMTVVGKTEGLNMLYGRKDACVLWDIRVADTYKCKGIGQKLMDMGVLKHVSFIKNKEPYCLKITENRKI